MIFTIVLNLIEALLYIVGYITLAMIIWGGFKYMLGGDTLGKVESAKNHNQRHYWSYNLNILNNH